MKHTYGHVLVLQSGHLVHPAADDDFMLRRTYGDMLVLHSRRLVHPAADDDFAMLKCMYGHMLCHQVNV